MSEGEMSVGKKGDDLTRKNIVQWTAHCDKLEARGNLSEAETRDLQYRRLQVARWLDELNK